MSSKLRSLKKKDKGSWKLTRQMTSSHEDVLQNIEFALVAAFRDHDAIDDRAALAVLEAALHNRQPDDHIVEIAVGMLGGIRKMRSDVSDDVWLDCLRLVIASVHRHSSLKPGDTGYLDFVRQFVQ